MHLSNTRFSCIKHAVAVAAKNEPDAHAVGSPGHFLQTEVDDLDDILIVKFSGELALLLVESDKERWKKNLHRENGEWVAHAKCDKVTCGTLNADLMTHKKLDNFLKE